MKLSLNSLAIAIAFAALGQNALAQSATQEYRDWSVTCNNIKTCLAYSVSNTSDDGARSKPRTLSEDISEGWMTIERAAGPRTVARISLSRPDLAEVTLPPTAEIQLIDDAGRIVPRGIFAATLGNRDVIEIAPSLNSQFLSAARIANYAVLVVGPVKRPIFYVSLSGLVASGRNIDARQGRTGTTSALIDIASRADTTVQAAPALPVVYAQSFVGRANATPPASLLQKRRTDCEDIQSSNPSGEPDFEAYTLDRTRTLWSVRCGLGAYNTWNRYYIQAPRNVITAATFSGSTNTDLKEANSLVNTEVDASKGIITTFNKGRGLGDCGIEETYAWNGQTFVIALRNEMIPCGGIVADFWPSSIVSRVVTR